MLDKIDFRNKYGISYAYLHEQIRKKLLRAIPLKCTKCGSTKHIELANLKNHQYSDKLSDYTFLCRKCHIEFDGRYDNLAQGETAILTFFARDPTATTRVCPRCNANKSLDEFYPNSSYCKTCSCELKKNERAIKGGPVLKLRSELARGVRCCKMCGLEKPISEFVKNGNTTRTLCGQCYRIYQRENKRVDRRCY